MENKTPKFKRPNPQGARSKSKIVRVAGSSICRVISTTEKSGTKTYRLLTSAGEIGDASEYAITPAREGDEANFNAQYQRHLRRLDADKIKGKKK